MSVVENFHKSVSIHIVTYNSDKYIVDCLDSVIRQSHSINEIVVVDNASTDHTITMLIEYSEHIKLFENQSNLGFAAAHNQAMKVTNSDYILVLNPDVTLDENYVSYLVEFMNDNQNVGSSTGKLLLKSSPNLIDSTGLLMSKARRVIDRGAGESADRWTVRDEVFGVSGAAVMYSRNMIDDISIEGQFFDEDFFAYKEDVDVAWRCRLLGWSAYFIPEAIAYHERGWKKNDRKKQPINIRRHSYINRYYMMLKNESMKYLLLHIPYILLYELSMLGYIVLNEPNLIKEWIRFWKKFKNNIKKRNIIISKQKVNLKDIYRFFI